MSSKECFSTPKINSIDEEVSVRVHNLSKCYQIYNHPEDRLKQSVIPKLQKLIGRPLTKYFDEYWAVKDVTFDIKRGETIGIIGQNGSGKSTILQMICGTVTPSYGSVEINGRVAALLELGSGFNHEFTGRENVFLNSAILGLSEEETLEKFEDIVSFADIGEFIDQPVKSYSSGMMLRLAFAVQSQVNPDILIIDEALAVGDAKFQAKCFDRLRQLKEKGTSIILVTHSSEQIVAHCSKAILLDHGIQLETGDPNFVVNRYHDLLFGKQQNIEEANCKDTNGLALKTYPKGKLSVSDDLFITRGGYNPHEYRWGNGQASILDFFIANDTTPYPSSVKSGERIRLSVTIKFFTKFIRPIFGVTIKTKEGITVYGANSETLECNQFYTLGQKGVVAQVDVEFICLLGPGDYFISLGVAIKSGEEIIPLDRRYDSIHLHVRPNPRMFGISDLNLIMEANEV